MFVFMIYILLCSIYLEVFLNKSFAFSRFDGIFYFWVLWCFWQSLQLFLEWNILPYMDYGCEFFFFFSLCF